jgi:hypothetical protein
MKEICEGVKGDRGEPVTKNRAQNASGKGSKLNFFLEKRVNERDGLSEKKK